MTHQLYISHPLSPTAHQRDALNQQFQVAETLWTVLAHHARHAAAGQPIDMVEIAGALRDGRPLPPLPELHTRITLPRHSNAARVSWLQAAAEGHDWMNIVGHSVVDGLVAQFGRALRSLGPAPHLRDIPLAPAPGLSLTLGGLARPITDVYLEVVGVDGLILYPGFMLPRAAETAITAWRDAFHDHLLMKRSALEAQVLAGSPQADAQLMQHLARYAAHAPHLRVPAAQPANEAISPMRLTYVEGARLHRTDEGFAIEWALRIDDLPSPRQWGLIAADPGMRCLWAWCTAYGAGHYPNPLPTNWTTPEPAPSRGVVQRVLDLDYAALNRQRLLYRTIQPVLEAGSSLFLDHQQIALEGTDWQGLYTQNSPFPVFAAYSGLTLYHQYISDVARLRGSPVILVPPAGTTSTCASCHGRQTMQFSGREGRCRSCQQSAHRDENAARNIYRCAHSLVAA